MPTSPLVSIVITSYNYGKYLRFAIESALSQDYANLEVLILDNASTDESHEIIRELAADPRVRAHFHASNIGPLANHNFGLQMARGDYLLFLSADDAFLPHHVSRLVAFARAHPECEVVYSDILFMDDAGRVSRRVTHPGIVPASYVGGRNELADMLSIGPYLCLPGVLVPRALFDTFGPFDEAVAQAADFELYCRWAVAGKQFAFTDEATVLYRMHPGNLSRHSFISSGQQLLSYVIILEKHVRPDTVWQLRGRWRTVLREFQNRIAVARSHPEAGVRATELAPRMQALVSLISSADAAVAPPADVPRFSVVIPATDRVRLLDRALASVAEQTVSDWEILVVSDGDMDLQAFLDGLAFAGRIRYLRQRTKYGPAVARNTGVRLARGNIIAYLDEDNWFEAHHLETLGNLIDADHPVAMSSARLLVETYSNELLPGPATLYVDEGAFDGGSMRWTFANAVPLNAVAHLRGCVDVSGLFNPDYTLFEDWDFLVRLFTASPPVTTAERTVTISQRLSLHEQYAGAHMHALGPSINRIYQSHATKDESTLAARHEQAQRLSGLFARLTPQLLATPAGVVEFTRALAGNPLR